MKMRELITGIFLIGAIAGCSDGIFSLNCTDIGCEDALTVVLDGYEGTEAKLVVEVPGGHPMIIDCGTHCGRVSLPEFTPRHVRITVVMGDQSIEHSADPEYRKVRPNGEDCPPECLHATVHVDVSGIA